MTTTLPGKSSLPIPREAMGSPAMPARVRGALRLLVSSKLNIVISSVCGIALFLLVPGIVRWALLDATWTGSSANCRGQRGACWAFIFEKIHFLLNGFYPASERWRGMVVVLLPFAFVAASTVLRLRLSVLILFAPIVLAAMYLLLAGGLLGLPAVASRNWGGLPLTVFLATCAAVFSFPLAVTLALARRSSIPVLKVLAVGLIEGVRGVPLVSILFMASVLFPLFMPEGVNFDRILRAQVALTIFAAAYLAEIIRAGIQGVDDGQSQAAISLGMRPGPTMLLVVLPQALRLAAPPLVSTFIVLVKDTSLVVTVGLTEFFGTVRTATTDPQWLGFHVEAYVFAAFVYFMMCKSIASYGAFLEQRFRLLR
jgi:general L-amino acid transport system permease protein